MHFSASYTAQQCHGLPAALAINERACLRTAVHPINLKPMRVRAGASGSIACLNEPS
jgi:hypothetical protein